MFSYSQAEPSKMPSRTWLPPPATDRILVLSDPNKRRAARKVDEPAERLVSRLLARDAAYAAKVAQVRRYQTRLRGQLTQLDWRLYLKLEEAEVGRWTHALERVARWALAFKSRARRSGT